MADLAGWAGKVYRNFAKIENLGLSDSEKRLNTQREIRNRLQKEYDALDKGDRARPSKNRALQAAEAEVIQLRAQVKAQTKARKDAERDRNKAADDVAGEATSQAEAEKAEAKRLKGIEKRRALSKRAHDDYLQASGQQILAIQEELKVDLDALSQKLEAGEDYSEARIELEQTAALRIKKIRDDESKDLKGNIEEQEDAYKGLFDFMERGFSDALATMLLDGELTFKSLAQSFVREFIQMGISKLVAQGFGQLSGVFGSFVNPQPGDTNFVGPVQQPGKANGGHIGGPTLVGERGPELFIPSTSGFVASNNALRKMSGAGGAVGPVNVTVINATGEDSSTSQKDGPGGGRDIEVMIGKAITKNIARGGDVDQAIRSSYGVQRVGRHGL
jgi:hypothetical protein